MTIISTAVTADQTATAAQYNNLRTDVIGAAVLCNTKTTGLTASTVYQAWANGGILVVFTAGTGSNPNVIDISSDASATPTTRVGYRRDTGATSLDGTVTVPIMPNHYYSFTAWSNYTANFYSNV